MTRLLQVLLLLLMTLVFAEATSAEVLFPTPEFSKHEIPDTTHPDVPSGQYEYLDLVALLAGLILASFFALVVRSRRGLFVLAIASLLWLGFWKEGCICPIGAIQNVTLALFDHQNAESEVPEIAEEVESAERGGHELSATGAIIDLTYRIAERRQGAADPERRDSLLAELAKLEGRLAELERSDHVSEVTLRNVNCEARRLLRGIAFRPTYVLPLVVLAIFILPMLFALFFGRTFCAAVCPLGAVQELVARRPIRVPVWLEQALGLLAYVYLGAAVVFAATGTAFLICRYDPFVAIFRLGGSVNMLIFGGCFLLIGVFVGRPYCRFLCPYGALLGLLSRVSKWHLAIPPQECIQCRLCEDVCPYGAIREPTVERPSGEVRWGRLRLAGLILLVPVLIGVGFVLGGLFRVPFSQLHPTVRLAEQIRLEKCMTDDVKTIFQKGKLTEDEAWDEVLQRHGQLERTTDASDTFRKTGRKKAELYGEALELTGRLGIAARWFGAWVGLVIGIKLIHLSARRRRSDYQPDRTGCVSCGRCFWYCPGEQDRRGWIRQPLIAKKKS